MSELLIVPSVTSTPELAITDEGERQKAALLNKAKPILAIADAKSRDHAIEVAGSIRTHLKAVEDSRVEVKEPFLIMSRLIDETARGHALQLRNELHRLNNLVGQFELDRQKEVESTREVIASPDLATALEAEEKITQLESVAKPTGGALRKDWDIEVTDIKALYAAHPQCVELSPRNLAIKDLLKAGITPAGVTATPKVAYAVKANAKKLR